MDGWFSAWMDRQTCRLRCVHGYMKKGAYNVAGQMRGCVDGGQKEDKAHSK